MRSDGKRERVVYPATAFFALPPFFDDSEVNQIPTTADAVIVGGGIVGLTTALALARAGLKVCVLERGVPGGEASWAGGGILSPLPPDDPAHAIRALLDESLALYPNFCESLRGNTGIDPEYWTCGACVLNDAGEHWFKKVAQVRNPRLIKALLLALRQHGVAVCAYTPALEWRIDAAGLSGIVTTQGVIASRRAVLAAGAWSAQLADVAVSPAKGQMLLLRSEGAGPDHIRMDPQAYLIPRKDGRLLIGSTIEQAGFDRAPTPQARELLLHCARQLWPVGGRWTVEHHWAGLRPQPASDTPTIAPHPLLVGLFINTGHFRLGLTLAPASAARCATQVLRV
ncbi:MAG: FAD-dependent oxidoreductase [Rhodanobacter sp.]